MWNRKSRQSATGHIYSQQNPVANYQSCKHIFMVFFCRAAHDIKRTFRIWLTILLGIKKNQFRTACMFGYYRLVIAIINTLIAHTKFYINIKNESDAYLL